MASLLHRLGRTAYRRWPFFLVGWLLVIAAVGGVAATKSQPFSDAFTIPGLESVEAAETIPELMDGEQSPMDAASIEVVIAAPKGASLAETKYADGVAELASALGKLDRVPDQIPVIWTAAQAKELAPAMAEAMSTPDAAVTPAQAEQMLLAQIDAQPSLSQDGRIGLLSTQFDVKTVADVTPAMQQQVLDTIKKVADDTGLQVEVRGAGMQTMGAVNATAEIVGIAVALVVLALTFGAFIAAGLPIVTALIGVALGSVGITALTAFTDLPSSTPMLGMMIGLAVGIDYTLFILSRYRSELEHTDDREEAVGIAVGTAGSAVVFAGLTVIIALAGLTVIGIPFMGWMGIGAAITVAVAVLVALTFLPALLGVLKSKAFGGTFRRYRPAREADGRIVNNGVRWARLVGKRPVAVVLLVVVALGALAVPFTSLKLGMPGDNTAPVDSSRYQAVKLIEEGFGPGRLDPMMLIVDARKSDRDAAAKQAAYAKVATWVDSLDGVARTVAQPGTDQGAIILVEPATAPDDAATQALLDTIRAGEPQLEQELGVDLAVTGTQPVMADISEKLNSALVPYLALVIGLAFILLMLVFRSLLVPLTATLGFLLSVLATLGATVAVFQEGAFGLFPPQPIVSFIPIFLIGIVFGLAMDYQVFLVTRMREAHVHGMTTREAVVDGFRNSARVVTAAAIIMAAVFSGFILMDDVIIKSLGFALAVAVLIDAFVVRMALIPALMYLMGEKAWYLPKWLDRILPNVDVEGESLQRARHPVGDGADGGDDLDADERELVSV
jgi:RND superfamily putative drug exporter